MRRDEKLNRCVEHDERSPNASRQRNVYVTQIKAKASSEDTPRQKNRRCNHPVPNGHGEGMIASPHNRADVQQHVARMKLEEAPSILHSHTSIARRIPYACHCEGDQNSPVPTVRHCRPCLVPRPKRDHPHSQCHFGEDGPMQVSSPPDHGKMALRALITGFFATMGLR